MNTTELYDLGLLAEVAYGNFITEQGNLISIDGNVKNILQGYNAAGTEQDGVLTLSATQADDFVDNWTIIAHQPDTLAGFSSTLIQNRQTGEQVYALRGTQGFTDLVITDAGDIVMDGLAIHQIVDMYNDWQRLKSSGGEYSVKVLEPLVVETGLLFAGGLAYKAYLSTREDIIIDEPSGTVYTIKPDVSTNIYDVDDSRYTGAGIALSGDLTATGHSLGGHLASAFSRLSGNEALTINGAGFVTGALPSLGLFAGTNIDNVFSMLDGQSSFNSNLN